jgi:hypothetical protein
VQAVNPEPRGLEHAADLSVTPLVERDLDHGLPRRRIEHAHRCRGAHHPGLELDAELEPLQHRGCGWTIRVRAVALHDPVARVHEVVRQLAVVGQDQEPAGVGVETAHREQPRAARKQVGDRPAPLGILERADHADRLVEQQVGRPRPARKRPALDLDHVVVRVDLPARLGAHLAVDTHLPGAHQRVGPAARGDAARGDVLVEPDAHAPAGSRSEA